MSPKILYTAFLLLLLCLPAGAETYYVRTDGNDSNPGTTDTAGGAWLTWSKAFSTVVAGDTVNIATGTYAGSATTAAHGTSGSPITIQGTGTLDGGKLTMRHSYWILDGLTIVNGAANAAIDIDGAFTPTGTIIRNITITNATQRGIRFFGGGLLDPDTGPSNFLIQNVTITNPAQNSIEVSGRGNIVENCEISGIGGDVFRAWGADHIFRNNFAHGLGVDPSGHPDCFQSWGQPNGPNWCKNILIENNYFQNDIHVMQGSPDLDFTNQYNDVTGLTPDTLPASPGTLDAGKEYSGSFASGTYTISGFTGEVEGAEIQIILTNSTGNDISIQFPNTVFRLGAFQTTGGNPDLLTLGNSASPHHFLLRYESGQWNIKDDYIDRNSGDFVADGLAIGETVYIYGPGANNKLGATAPKRIQHVTPTRIYMQKANMFSDASGLSGKTLYAAKIIQTGQMDNAIIGKTEGVTFRGNVFDGISASGTAQFPDTNFYNNTWVNCALSHSNVMAYGAPSSGNIINNVFVGCGRGQTGNGLDNSRGWYGHGGFATPDYNFVANADFSGVNQTTPPGTGFDWGENNGINGGNPTFRGTVAIGTNGLGADNLPFTADDLWEPLAGSFLKLNGINGTDIGAYGTHYNPASPSKPNVTTGTVTIGP